MTKKLDIYPPLVKSFCEFSIFMTELSLDFMKTQPALTLIATAIALSLPVAFAPQAQAAGIVRGSTATTSLTTTLGTIANVTNQSGLSASYVSGTTDFDSYVATTTHTGADSNAWRFTPPTGFIAFDLGASYTLDALALWPNSPIIVVPISPFAVLPSMPTPMPTPLIRALLWGTSMPLTRLLTP